MENSIFVELDEGSVGDHSNKSAHLAASIMTSDVVNQVVHTSSTFIHAAQMSRLKVLWEENLKKCDGITFAGSNCTDEKEIVSNLALQSIRGSRLSSKIPPVKSICGIISRPVHFMKRPDLREITHSRAEYGDGTRFEKAYFRLKA